ncbi:MAG: phosphatase [Cyanobacteria bacterium Co-bin13]|nr:phosphatase [Cyanobacteria bacterium Co-bin13]
MIFELLEDGPLAENICPISPDYSSAGQITPEQLQQARQSGFKSVLNLRSPDEADFVSDEAAQAEVLGLAYSNAPVDPKLPESDPLNKALYALENLPKPVLVHCRGGARATAVALAAIAVQENLTLEQFIQQVTEQGLPLEQPQIQQFLQDHYGVGRDLEAEA